MHWTCRLPLWKGRKWILEDKILELEAQNCATNRQEGDPRTLVEELEAQNRSLETQLKTANERHPEITPFHDQACIIRRKTHEV